MARSVPQTPADRILITITESLRYSALCRLTARPLRSDRRETTACSGTLGILELGYPSGRAGPDKGKRLLQPGLANVVDEHRFAYSAEDGHPKLAPAMFLGLMNPSQEHVHG